MTYNFDRPKRSLGTLKRSTKTKPLSPDCTGTIVIRKHTLDEINRQFHEGGGEEVVANIAGWLTRDSKHQEVMNVELSPRFFATRPPSSENAENVFAAFRHSDDE